MKKKYIICIAIILICIIGIFSWIFINGSKKEIVNLKITCGEEVTNNEYKKGDSFKCDLHGNEFEIKVEDISSKKIKLTASDYGLYPEREDKTISLIDKVNNFELEKDKELVLELQATDVSEKIVISWE